ncbi:MAG: Abia family HEPN domain-containing protein [Finegoldia magna]|nr:Abia family HEPN domain-containing protein [Finegoldia magna]
MKCAHDLRNANPMSHSSAGLIDKSTTSNDLKKCIDDLNSLIDNYRTIHR